jgi:hypothetical protein
VKQIPDRVASTEATFQRERSIVEVAPLYISIIDFEAERDGSARLLELALVYISAGRPVLIHLTESLSVFSDVS